MPYMDPFSKVVTLSKANHRYYGPTESKKFRQELTSIATDLKSIFYEMQVVQDNLEAMASGYLLPSGSLNSLYDLKRKVFSMEDKWEMRTYVQAIQNPSFSDLG
jgi:hypothetical protein